MANEAAKEFVERLSMDQGRALAVAKQKLMFLGGCRNCNSSRCQCDGRPAASIAPAASSSSPPTPISGGIPSPYSMGYSPSFTAPSPSQMRGNVYPGNTPQYHTIPQFTNMPTFGLFQDSQSHSSSSGVNPNISAQVQQFQRRQEYLMASTQRRIQQEAELARKYHRDSENFIGSLQHQPTPPLVDPYHHRASLPVNFESSAHHDITARDMEHHSNLKQHPYRDSRGSESANIGGYNYVHDISQAIPYATALSTTFFRHPSVIELEHRRKSVPLVTTGQSHTPSETPAQEPVLASKSATESNSSSQISVSLNITNSENAVLDDDTTTDSVDEYRVQSGEPQQESSIPKSKGVEIDEEAVGESFPGLEKMFDSWDAADNEWLYSLQTECARPGAVCECGDSCCCPGCFTHTNNPGDRGVYSTLLNKMGAILETEKEELEINRSKPCHSSSTLAGNPDEKL